MSSTFRVPLLGELTLLEVYEYYDEPVLFSCADGTERLYLAVLSEESPDTRTWLYTPLSLSRFELLRSGTASLKAAFTDSEIGQVLRVVQATGDEDAPLDAGWVGVGTLDDRELPLEHTHLDAEQGQAFLPWHAKYHNLLLGKSLRASGLTTDLVAFMDLDDVPGVRLRGALAMTPQQRVARTARESRRETFALICHFRGSPPGEAPADALGQVLDTIQQVVSAIGQARGGHATSRGSLPANVRQATQLQYTGSFDSSFGAVLQAEIAEQADLFEPSASALAIEELLDLVDATASDVALIERITSLKGRTIAKYREFLLRLTGRISSTEFVWASPRHPGVRTAEISEKTARRAAKALEKVPEEESLDFEVLAELVGFNARTNVFEIRDVIESTRYVGKVDDGALETVGPAIIEQAYTALLRRTSERTVDGEQRYKFTLLRLGSPDPGKPESPADETE